MPPHIVVAGGGVAALETIAALRALAGTAPEITMLAPAARAEHRPASIGTPFGARQAVMLSLADLAEELTFELRLGALERVDPEQHTIDIGAGAALGYDTLVVATGAVPEPAFPGAITFNGVADAPAVTEAIETAKQLVFVSAVASGWALPIYEMALMAALTGKCGDIAVVTAEPAPLFVFGAEAGEAIHELFVERRIALLTGVKVLALADGRLELDGVEPISADRAIALPRLVGPAIAGLPHDEEGFLPVDPHCAVVGVPDVYAAGDAIAFPLKQGGLATQQADAAAQAIAAALGAPVTPEPFQPVLRGLLITGRAPLYLRSDGSRGSSRRLPHAAVSGRALWWPPGKVAGRYLAPLVAGPDAPNIDEVLREMPEAGGETPQENAADLALAMADEDAASGDYLRALRTLEVAEELIGGDLPPVWERSRTMWRARAEASQS